MGRQMGRNVFVRPTEQSVEKGGEESGEAGEARGAQGAGAGAAETTVRAGGQAR